MRVAGPEAGDFLQRVLSNDVLAGDHCQALLLTPKGRVIALMRVWRRSADDFLLLTEIEQGEVLLRELRRLRIATKCEIEPEEHTSVIVFDPTVEGIPNDDYGIPAVEAIDSTKESAHLALAAHEAVAVLVGAGDVDLIAVREGGGWLVSPIATIADAASIAVDSFIQYYESGALDELFR